VVNAAEANEWAALAHCAATARSLYTGPPFCGPHGDEIDYSAACGSLVRHWPVGSWTQDGLADRRDLLVLVLTTEDSRKSSSVRDRRGGARSSRGPSIPCDVRAPGHCQAVLD